MPKPKPKPRETPIANVPEVPADLARQKLELEIRALRSPLRNNPALWITVVTTIIAVAGFFLQMQLSRKEYLVAEQQTLMAKVERERAEIDTIKLKQELERLKTDAVAAKAQIATLTQQLAGKTSELGDINERIAIANARLEKTQKRLEEGETLLVRAGEFAPADLKKEIKTFAEKRKFYDPTGKFPYHVPPQQ